MTVVLLTKPECVWCERAKELLRDNNMEFRDFSLVEHEILREFIITQGLRSVPQIYINGKHVGGFEGLKDYIELRRSRY